MAESLLHHAGKFIAALEEALARQNGRAQQAKVGWCLGSRRSERRSTAAAVLVIKIRTIESSNARRELVELAVLGIIDPQITSNFVSLFQIVVATSIPRRYDTVLTSLKPLV